MTNTSSPKRTPRKSEEPEFTSIEICAGAGGQAVGLHQAGFRHLALVEIDDHAVETLRLNIRDKRAWAWERRFCDILPADVKEFDPDTDLLKSGHLLAKSELDLLAGGVPCPPFSHAGKQLGKYDERDLFPRMLELSKILRPRAVMIENVRGIMDPKFKDYRDWITAELEGNPIDSDDHRYTVCNWGVLEASDFGVPQLRPRAVLVAIRRDVLKAFNAQGLTYAWPEANPDNEPISVAKSLEPSMRERFEPYFDGDHADKAHKAFDRWLTKASMRDELKEKGGSVAPTLVGGSKKHGGADLGPSRAKAAWKQLGISGMGVANDIKTCLEKHSEGRDLWGDDGPMLTVKQAAIIQGFPADWEFSGGKTAQYRQVGNAFPPPVAKAVGESIIEVLAAVPKVNRSSSEDDTRDESGQLSFNLLAG